MLTAAFCWIGCDEDWKQGEEKEVRKGERRQETGGQGTGGRQGLFIHGPPPIRSKLSKHAMRAVLPIFGLEG